MLKTKIKAKTGLHARPASLLVKAASAFQSDVYLIKDQEQYNCKSIMSIMSSNMAYGDEITIEAVGQDAAQAEAQVLDIIDGIED